MADTDATTTPDTTESWWSKHIFTWDNVPVVGAIRAYERGDYAEAAIDAGLDLWTLSTLGLGAVVTSPLRLAGGALARVAERSALKAAGYTTLKKIAVTGLDVGAHIAGTVLRNPNNPLGLVTPAANASPAAGPNGAVDAKPPGAAGPPQNDEALKKAGDEKSLTSFQDARKGFRVDGTLDLGDGKTPEVHATELDFKSDGKDGTVPSDFYVYDQETKEKSEMRARFDSEQAAKFGDGKAVPEIQLKGKDGAFVKADDPSNATAAAAKKAEIDTFTKKMEAAENQKKFQVASAAMNDAMQKMPQLEVDFGIKVTGVSNPYATGKINSWLDQMVELQKKVQEAAKAADKAGVKMDTKKIVAGITGEADFLKYAKNAELAAARGDSVFDAITNAIKDPNGKYHALDGFLDVFRDKEHDVVDSNVRRAGTSTVFHTDVPPALQGQSYGKDKESLDASPVDPSPTGAGPRQALKDPAIAAPVPPAADAPPVPDKKAGVDPTAVAAVVKPPAPSPAPGTHL